MSKDKDDKVYLQHILQATQQIEEYLDGVSYEEFMREEMIQDAVMRQLEIIGEAVKNLSFELRQKHPLVPWREAAGTRDKLIHEYFGVSLDAVWQTVTQNIGELETQIETILIELEHTPQTS